MDFLQPGELCGRPQTAALTAALLASRCAESLPAFLVARAVYWRGARPAFTAAFSLAVLAVDAALKRAVQMPRPPASCFGDDGRGFPSTHVTLCFSVATLETFLLCMGADRARVAAPAAPARAGKKPAARLAGWLRATGTCSVWFAGAALVAWSSVQLGYASDLMVRASAVAGALMAVLVMLALVCAVCRGRSRPRQPAESARQRPTVGPAAGPGPRAKVD